MTDTRYQLHDRIDNLTGELRAAEEQDRLNADDLAAKEHSASLARQAKEKSEANIVRIRNAIRAAGSEYSAQVLELAGPPDAPVADEAAPAAEFAGMTMIEAAAGLYPSPPIADDIETEPCALPVEFATDYQSSLYTNGIDDAYTKATQP